MKIISEKNKDLIRELLGFLIGMLFILFCILGFIAIVAIIVRLGAKVVEFICSTI